MTMTSKVKPYKAGFGPFAPEVYRAPGAVPVSRHLVRRFDRRARAPLQGRRRPVDRRLRRPRAGQGEGGFVAMPPDYPREAARALPRARDPLGLDEVQSGVGRTGTMWAVEQYAGAEPDMTVFGKSIGGGLPLAGVTAAPR
jgi:4-aminobutyrate aminotransferase-like enzyme